jgi:hypothetical protein
MANPTRLASKRVDTSLTPHWGSGYYRSILEVQCLVTQRQQAIDGLSVKMEEAARNYIGKIPKNPPDWPSFNNDLQAKTGSWRKEVSGLLENRAFFTKADQLHFDVLGHYSGYSFRGGNAEYDEIQSELAERMKKLREVINWSQQRTR